MSRKRKYTLVRKTQSLQEQVEGLYFQKVPFSLGWVWSIENIAEGPWVTPARPSPYLAGEKQQEKIKASKTALSGACSVVLLSEPRLEEKTQGENFSCRPIPWPLLQTGGPVCGQMGALNVLSWPTLQFLQPRGPLVLGEHCFHFPTGVLSFPLAGLSAGNATAWTWCLQQLSFKGDLGI